MQSTAVQRASLLQRVIVSFGLAFMNMDQPSKTIDTTYDLLLVKRGAFFPENLKVPNAYVS